MTMDDFAEIVKKSHLVANAKTDIIFRLLKVLGAKDAVSESTMCGERQVSDQSPSKAAIQSWLSGRSKPGVLRYFPNLKVENEENAHNFLRKTAKKEQWVVLRDLFKEWHNSNQNTDKDFYINTETDDFITFSTSFWRQFVSFFSPLRMWDDAEEQYPEKEDERQNVRNKITNEMIDAFKKEYMWYKVYEFIPKEIDIIINSLSIYYKILREQAKVEMNENVASDNISGWKVSKMYCKWSPGFDYFIFNEITHYGDYWEVRLSGESFIRFKFDEDLDNMQNTCLTTRFKYTFADSSLSEDMQLGDEVLSWEENEGEIIIVDIDFPIDCNFSSPENYPIIEDCHVLIDDVIALEYLINQFMTAINEKIIKKYEGIAFDDNSRLLYNAITRYRKLLKKFKKNLIKFRELRKEKDEYLNDKALKQTFDMYQAFHDFEISEKPHYPFSECYIDQSKADEVKKCLYCCHDGLMELYAEICNYKKNM